MSIAQAPIVPARETVERTDTPGVPPERLLAISQMATGAFLSLVAVMLLLMASVAIYASQYDARAYAGLSIAGIDVGGLSEAEIRQRVDAVLRDYADESISITTPSDTIALSLEELGVSYDVDATVDLVLRQGRDGSWWDRSIAIASSRLHGREIEPVVRLDADRFQAALEALSPSVITGFQDAYVDMRASGGPAIVAEVPGTAIDSGATLHAVLDRARHLSSRQVPLALVPIPADVTAQQLAAGLPGAQRAVGAPLTVSDASGSWALTQEELRQIVSVARDGGVTIDTAQVERFVAGIAASVDQPSRDAGVAVNGDGHLVIIPAEDSAAVDQQATVNAIVGALGEGSVSVPLVVERHAPHILDADARAAVARADEMVGDGVTLTWQGEPVHLGRGDLLAALLIEPQPGAEQPFALSFDPDVLAERLRPIADELAVEPVDVQFRLLNGEVKLQSEARQGREVDIDASLENILSSLGQNRFDAALVVTTLEPRYTSADRDSIAVPDLLGDSWTYYGDSSEARRHNVERASELEQGWLIPPGGIFSYAGFMGLVTKENGFITGFGIVAEEGGGVTTAPVVGGGICQVSTTIFQAAWWAGLPIVERWAHPYWLNGYGQAPRGMKGLDAMVNIEPDWALDLKFKNTTGNWIALVMTADGENVRAEIYGVNPGWTVDVAQPVISNIVKPDDTMIYTESPELPKGQELRVETAQEGFDAAITRVVKDRDGQELDRYVLESTYAASRNTTLRGTGESQ